MVKSMADHIPSEQSDGNLEPQKYLHGSAIFFYYFLSFIALVLKTSD